MEQAVLGANTWVYGYDALNRLRSVRYNGTLIARYAYDVLGRRIAKRVYSSVTGGTVAYTRFVYHGSQVGFETDSTGTIGLRYTWGLEVDDLIAVRDAAGNHYYAVNDRLRNIRALIRRSDGIRMFSQRFRPYGAVLGHQDFQVLGFTLRYGWTGREYDAETGWYFFRARYYDPGPQRFVQEDPVGYAGGRSLYAYGAGNPLVGRDPDGLMMDADQYMVKELCLSHLCRGPDVYIDGGSLGSSRLAAEAVLGLSGAGAGTFTPTTLSPLTTLEREGRRLSAYEQAANPICDVIDCNSVRTGTLAAIIYNETAGLRGNGAELFYARAAIGEVLLNRLAKGLPVGDGRGTAFDYLSSQAQRAIDAGNLAAVGAWMQAQLAVRLASRSGDITNGGLFFHIERTLWESRDANEANLIRYGPFTNVQFPGQWYIWIW